MPAHSGNPRETQSQFTKLDRDFLDETRALAGSIVLSRPLKQPAHAEWVTQPPFSAQLALPKRPRWRYDMSKAELDANEHACFRAWLAQQDAVVGQWQRASASVDESEMPRPPTHFERNIEVWRQFWRVTEISQILLVLLDSRCPLLHLPPSLSSYLGSRQNAILVLTKVDISGHARTAAWTSFLHATYPSAPIVPVEAYARQTKRHQPHLPGAFREKLVHALRNVHEQLLRPPPWVTSPRPGESEEKRLQRVGQWKPRVKRVVDWDGVLQAKGKLVGKAVGGAAAPKGDAEHVDEGDEDQAGVVRERKEPEFLTVGVIGHPNVGKSSLLNALFGSTRVRASRTPGKTRHFQTLFWTSDVRLVDCPGLVMPSFVPMDIQVLSGVLPISRISAVPFCVHQLARLFPLERILELAHPSSSEPGSKPALVEDKRTWRSGQRPPERSGDQSGMPRWTANDVMIAYANKRGWVTAKAGRPDIHRAGNAILRLVAEGKIPWALWPPGSPASGDDGDGIWLKDGVHAWDELDGEEQDSDTELSSEEETEDEGENEEPVIRRGTLGRFAALRVE